MIVMNMDSNIKDNVEPVTWPTIEAARLLVIRGVDLISAS
jgi:hypothetical protein